MAELINTAIDRLMPPGKAWRFFGDLRKFMDALSLSIIRVKSYMTGVLAEAIPKTSTDLIEEWHNALSLSYDSAQDLTQLRARVDAAFTATGGQSLGYLEGQMQREFPEVYIQEVDIYNYDLLGNVLTVRDFYRLISFVDRYFPLHLVPFFNVTIVETLDTAYTGIAITGKAITGKVVEVT